MSEVEYSSIIWLGKSNKYTIVDNDMVEALCIKKWCVLQSGYAQRNRWEESEKRYYNLMMHRFILSAKKGEEVDHVNGNPLDNRKANLRICSRAQNSANTKVPRNNKSGFKGVSWNKSAQKYRSYISVNRNLIHLGSFKTVIDAARAYDAAAIEYNGEFARTNKMMGLYE